MLEQTGLGETKLNDWFRNYHQKKWNPPLESIVTPAAKRQKGRKQLAVESIIKEKYSGILSKYNTTFQVTRAALYFPEKDGGRATIQNSNKNEGWTVGTQLLVDIDDPATLEKIEQSGCKFRNDSCQSDDHIERSNGKL